MSNDSGTNWPGGPQDEDRWEDANGLARPNEGSDDRRHVYQPPATVARRIIKAIVFAFLGLIALVVIGFVALYITCSGQNSW